MRAALDLGRLVSLLGATWRRRGWTRHSVAALVVASRAIWTERECRALARRLAGLARRARAIPDAHAALLGALRCPPGVLVRRGAASLATGPARPGRSAPPARRRPLPRAAAAAA